MGTRENFSVQTEVVYPDGHLAADAILMTIADVFGTDCVKRRHSQDDGDQAEATIRCQAEAMDARQVNWLHERLHRLGNHLDQAAEVTYQDSKDGSGSYPIGPETGDHADVAVAEDADSE